MWEAAAAAAAACYTARKKRERQTADSQRDGRAKTTSPVRDGRASGRAGGEGRVGGARLYAAAAADAEGMRPLQMLKGMLRLVTGIPENTRR